MTFLSKIAAVLDAVADERDALPSVGATPDPLIARLEARVGAPIPDDVRHKLAEDEELRRVLAPVIEAPEAPRPMGGPSEKSASGTAPLSRDERLRLANQAFEDAIMSRSAR